MGTGRECDPSLCDIRSSRRCERRLDGKTTYLSIDEDVTKSIAAVLARAGATLFTHR